MKTNKKSLTTLAVSMAMAALVLLPLHMNAQYDENRFGLQEWGQTSLLGKQGTGTRSDGSTLGNEAFGAAGSQINNEPFGVPLGGGLGILLAAGMGYAFIQSKKNKQN